MVGYVLVVRGGVGVVRRWCGGGVWARLRSGIKSPIPSHKLPDLPQSFVNLF